MDDKRLKEIEARCDAATDGPWFGNSYGFICGKLWIPMNAYHSDMKFITKARTDLPDCVAEIRRLQAEVERLSKPSVRQIAEEHGIDLDRCKDDTEIDLLTGKGGGPPE